MNALTVEQIRERWRLAAPGPWAIELNDSEQAMEEMGVDYPFYHLMSISDEFIPHGMTGPNGIYSWSRLIVQIDAGCEEDRMSEPDHEDLVALVNAPTDIQWLISEVERLQSLLDQGSLT